MSANQTDQVGGCLGSMLNVLTAALLALAVLAILGVVVVFVSPGVLQALGLSAGAQPDRPLPTAAAVAALPSVTSTPTEPALLPTWTPMPERATVTPAPTNTRSPTLTPSLTPIFPSRTPTPTATPTPTDTPTETPIGPTPTSSPTRSAFPFTRTDNSPFYLQNYANNAGCQWLGIAGEVLDLNRNPVPPGSYRVHVWGPGIGDRYLDVGTATDYSPSGWEQFVNDSPVVRDYNLQLETPNGTAVSQVYTVTTRASCNQNLVRFDFVQNH